MIPHLPVLPVVVPAVLGAVMVLAVRHDMLAKRTLSLAGMATLMLLALLILRLPQAEVYRLGDWPAPFA